MVVEYNIFFSNNAYDADLVLLSELAYNRQHFIDTEVYYSQSQNIPVYKYFCDSLWYDSDDFYINRCNFVSEPTGRSKTLWLLTTKEIDQIDTIKKEAKSKNFIGEFDEIQIGDFILLKYEKF